MVENFMVRRMTDNVKESERNFSTGARTSKARDCEEKR